MPPKPATAAASPDAPAPLVLDRVTKRYGRGAPIIADFSASFEPGTATALVGPNGSGKTTLLRLLAAQAFPTEGAVRYGALDVHAHPYRYLRHVGLVTDGGLPEALTAEELLEWVLRARGRWDGGAPARIAVLLDAVRLDERRANPIGTYSSGMVRKAQIAAALAPEPDVLLLDEPFRGLDAPSTEATLDLLRGVKRRGGLVVLSSHDPAALAAIADRTLDLHGLRAGTR